MEIARALFDRAGTSVVARVVPSLLVAALVAGAARDARANDSAANGASTAPVAAPAPSASAAPAALVAPAPPFAVPPPLNTPYLQYGVAFTAEFVPDAGGLCTNLDAAHLDSPCIFGPGGGIAARVGRRSAGPIYWGGAYELTKQDSNKLYRLATLQQLRFELRYYLSTGRDTQPYGAVGGGLAGYGNEGGIDTWGPAAFVAIGVETQLSRRTVIGVALTYRVFRFNAFHDSSGADRGVGLAQVIGLELALEGRDPL